MKVKLHDIFITLCKFQGGVTAKRVNMERFIIWSEDAQQREARFKIFVKRTKHFPAAIFSDLTHFVMTFRANKPMTV